MRWMTMNEAAEATRFTRQWVEKRIADGTFKAEKKGSRVHVDGNTVQAWMEAEMADMKQRWTYYAHHLPNGYHGKPQTD